MPAWARPQGGYRVDSGGHCVGSLFVVDPPADEVRPCFGGVAVDLESDLAHPVNPVEEFLVTQADAVLRVVLVGYLDTHRPGDPVEGLESAAQAQPRG